LVLNIVTSSKAPENQQLMNVCHGGDHISSVSTSLNPWKSYICNRKDIV